MMTAICSSLGSVQRHLVEALGLVGGAEEVALDPLDRDVARLALLAVLKPAVDVDPVACVAGVEVEGLAVAALAEPSGLLAAGDLADGIGICGHRSASASQLDRIMSVGAMIASIASS